MVRYLFSSWWLSTVCLAFRCSLLKHCGPLWASVVELVHIVNWRRLGTSHRVETRDVLDNHATPLPELLEGMQSSAPVFIPSFPLQVLTVAEVWQQKRKGVKRLGGLSWSPSSACSFPSSHLMTSAQLDISDQQRQHPVRDECGPL